MGRKNRRQKIETFVIPKDIIIAKEKPRYNAHQGGYGAHGENRYTRKEKHKKNYKDCANY